jgi:hypothetical protein
MSAKICQKFLYSDFTLDVNPLSKSCSTYCDCGIQSWTLVVVLKYIVSVIS